MQQRIDRRWPWGRSLRAQARVKRCGKSAPGRRQRRAAWQTPLAARPSRERGTARPVRVPGRPQEAVGDGGPRWMTFALRSRGVQNSAYSVRSPFPQPLALLLRTTPTSVYPSSQPPNHLPPSQPSSLARSAFGLPTAVPCTASRGTGTSVYQVSQPAPPSQPLPANPLAGSQRLRVSHSQNLPVPVARPRPRARIGLRKHSVASLRRPSPARP